MWGGGGGVGQNIGEQEGWEQTLDLAPHSNALPYDTLLTVVRVWCVCVLGLVCVCVGGGGGRSEHWRAGMMETVWMWPCTATFCSMTLC